MSTLQQMAAWKSQQNPLEHVIGGGRNMSHNYSATGGSDNAQMILVSPDFDEPVKNLRGMYMDKAKIEGQDVIVFDSHNHREITETGVCGTLTSSTNHGSGNAGTLYVGQPPRYRIRKLTERECFRLMGVRDKDSARLAKHQPKSSMYHLAGDSIVTACLMGIFGELLGVEWESKAQELQRDISLGYVLIIEREKDNELIQGTTEPNGSGSH